MYGPFPRRRASVSKTLLILTAASCLAACAANDAHSQRTAKTYSWVWIVTGPKDGSTTGEARNDALRGHFTNMDRMATAGDLLIAGPFAEPKAARHHRGVFVLDTDDAERASALANSDPAGRAGIFLFDIEAFASADDLRRVPERHERAVRESGLETPGPGFHCRSYVLAMHEDVEAARRSLASDRVLFSGVLGQGSTSRYLVCLDATTKDEASAIVAASQLDAWVLMPWFASEEVARLRLADATKS